MVPTILTPKMIGVKKASHTIPKTGKNVLHFKSRLYLACSDTKLSAKSHFGHFWVVDLTSEVTG